MKDEREEARTTTEIINFLLNQLADRDARLAEAAALLKASRRDDVTPCPHCYSMTKTVKGKCGKCGLEKREGAWRKQ